MRRSKPRDKRSRRPPKSRDKARRMTRRSTRSPNVSRATMAIDNRYDEVVDRVTNFQKGGDNRVHTIKSYRQVNKLSWRQSTETHTAKSTEKSTEKSTSQVLPTSQKPTGMQSTETHREVDREVYQEVAQSCPTDKPKAHQDAIYWDSPRSRPRSLPEVDRKVYQVDQDSTEASFREHNHEVDLMVTEANFQRRLPCQPASGSQCHLPTTTAWEIFDEALHEGSRERRHAWIW